MNQYFDAHKQRKLNKLINLSSLLTNFFVPILILIYWKFYYVEPDQIESFANLLSFFTTDNSAEGSGNDSQSNSQKDSVVVNMELPSSLFSYVLFYMCSYMFLLFNTFGFSSCCFRIILNLVVLTIRIASLLGIILLREYIQVYTRYASYSNHFVFGLLSFVSIFEHMIFLLIRYTRPFVFFSSYLTIALLMVINVNYSEHPKLFLFVSTIGILMWGISSSRDILKTLHEMKVSSAISKVYTSIFGEILDNLSLAITFFQSPIQSILFLIKKEDQTHGPAQIPPLPI